MTIHEKFAECQGFCKSKAAALVKKWYQNWLPKNAPDHRFPFTPGAFLGTAKTLHTCTFAAHLAAHRASPNATSELR